MLDFKFTILTPWTLLSPNLPEDECVDGAADEFANILCERTLIELDRHSFWPRARGEAFIRDSFDSFEERFLRQSEYAVIVLSGHHISCLDTIYPRFLVFLTRRPSWRERLLLVFLGSPQSQFLFDIKILTHEPIVFHGSVEDSWVSDEDSWTKLLGVLRRNYWPQSMENSRVQSRSHTPMSSDANWVSVTDLHGRPLAVKITQGSSVTNLMPTSLQNLSRFDRDSWANHNRPQSANGDYLTFSQSVPHVTEPDRRTRTGSCGQSDSWNNFDSPFGRSSSVPPTQGGVDLLEHPHGTVKPTDSCSAPFSPYVRRSGECKYPGYHYYPESEAHSVIEEQDEEQGLNPAGCSKDPGERACQLEPEENGGMCIPKATLALRRHRQVSEKLSDHTFSSVNPDELSDESSGKHNRSALRILKLPRRRAKSSSDGKSSPATDETEQKQRLKRLKEKACLFLKSNKRGEKFGSRSKQALGGTLKSLAGFTTGILSIDPDAPRRDVVGAHSCPDIHRTRSGHSPTEAFKSFASVSDSSPSGAANSHQFLSDNNHRYRGWHVLVDDHSANRACEPYEVAPTANALQLNTLTFTEGTQTDASSVDQNTKIQPSNLCAVRMDSGRGSMSPLPTDESCASGSRSGLSSTCQVSPYPNKSELQVPSDCSGFNLGSREIVEEDKVPQKSDFVSVLPRNLPCPVSDQCPSGSVVRGDEHSKLTFSAPLETFVTSEMPITEEHLKSVPVQDQYAMKRMIVGDTETKVAFGACEANKGANNRQNDSGLEPTTHEPTDTQIILSTDLFSVPPNTDKQEVIPVPETLTNGRESGPHQFIESQKTSIPEPCYKSIERTCRTSLAPDQDQPKSRSTLLPNDQLTNETTSILEPDIPRPGVNAAVTIEPKITTVGQLLETDMNMSVYTDMTEPNSCQSSEVLSAGTRDLFSQSTEPSEKSEGTTEIHYSQLIPYDLDQEVGEGDASLVGIPDISSFVTSAEHRLIGSTDYTSDMVSDASLDFTEIKTDSKTTLSDVGTLDRRTKQFLQSTVPGDCQQLVAEIIEFDSGLDGEVSDTAQWNSEISNASVQLQNPPPVAVKGHSLLVSNCPSLETFPGAFVNANQLKQGVEKNEINSATVTFGSDTEEIRMKASGSIGQTNFVFGEADTSSCDNTEAAASEISRDESITLGERTRKPVEELTTFSGSPSERCKISTPQTVNKNTNLRKSRDSSQVRSQQRVVYITDTTEQPDSRLSTESEVTFLVKNNENGPGTSSTSWVSEISPESFDSKQNCSSLPVRETDMDQVRPIAAEGYFQHQMGDNVLKRHFAVNGTGNTCGQNLTQPIKYLSDSEEPIVVGSQIGISKSELDDKKHTGIPQKEMINCDSCHSNIEAVYDKGNKLMQKQMQLALDTPSAQQSLGTLKQDDMQQNDPGDTAVLLAKIKERELRTCYEDAPNTVTETRELEEERQDELNTWSGWFYQKLLGRNTRGSPNLNGNKNENNTSASDFESSRKPHLITTGNQGLRYYQISAEGNEQYDQIFPKKAPLAALEDVEFSPVHNVSSVPPDAIPSTNIPSVSVGFSSESTSPTFSKETSVVQPNVSEDSNISSNEIPVPIYGAPLLGSVILPQGFGDDILRETIELTEKQASSGQFSQSAKITDDENVPNFKNKITDSENSSFIGDSNACDVVPHAVDLMPFWANTIKPSTVGTTPQGELPNECQPHQSPTDLRSKDHASVSHTKLSPRLERSLNPDEDQELPVKVSNQQEVRGELSTAGQRPSEWHFIMASSLFHFLTIYIPRHTYWFYSATFESRERLYEAMSERGARLAIAWERIDAGLRNPYCVAMIFVIITSAAPHLSQWPQLLDRLFRQMDVLVLIPPFWVDRPILYHLGQMVRSVRRSLHWHGQTVITSFSRYPWALVSPPE